MSTCIYLPARMIVHVVVNLTFTATRVLYNLCKKMNGLGASKAIVQGKDFTNLAKEGCQQQRFELENKMDNFLLATSFVVL